MLVLIAIAFWHALEAGSGFMVHWCFTHPLLWLIEPNVARYGACIDCGDERARRAMQRKHAATGRYSD